MEYPYYFSQTRGWLTSLKYKAQITEKAHRLHQGFTGWKDFLQNYHAFTSKSWGIPIIVTCTCIHFSFEKFSYHSLCTLSMSEWLCTCMWVWPTSLSTTEALLCQFSTCGSSYGGTSLLCTSLVGVQHKVSWLKEVPPFQGRAYIQLGQWKLSPLKGTSTTSRDILIR